MALIQYLDKDKDIPDTEPRGAWRDVDANEVKAVVNANQNALPAAIQTAINNLVLGAPGALDTLDELAAALGDDPNFAATVMTQLGLKAPLASPTFTGSPVLPTATQGVTQPNGDNSQKLATTAYADGKISELITDGVITSAPSQNAVFDALAGKQATLVSGTTIKQVQGVSILGSGNIILIDDAIVDGEAKAPSQNAVFDALALKASIAYVDDVVSGLDITFKPLPAAVATTVNITLSGEQTIDGVATSASRVLVKNQTGQSQNGIYVSAAGSWSRATDADAAAELEGAAINVTGGSQAGSNWMQTTNNITLGGSDIIWIPLGGTTPDANSSTKGIVRLYTVTGGNTDGTMDQNSITVALATKQASLVSGTNIKTVNGNSIVGAGDIDLIDDAIVDGETKAPTQNAVFDALALKAPVNNPTFTGTVSGITQAMVGLGSINNTSDLAKPISNATQTALNAKVSVLNLAKRVALVGTKNGSNPTFTIPQALVLDSEEFFRNGSLQLPTIDYTIVDQTITTVIPPESWESLVVNFTRP